MAEQAKEKNALLIEYNYSIEDYDACKGYRTYHYTGEALLIEHDGREVMVVYRIGKGYFFPIKKRIADGTIEYEFYMDIPLPNNVHDYKIIKQVSIEEKLARDIVKAAEWINKFLDIRRKATSFLLKSREKK